MSAPSSSAPRGTAPTASQNPVTAPVIKFRCLYTHDLRRKSKRWQDGYLRYHAFNKRIMVYDEQGNYIGDHHWRSGEEVQDGDELELDKGALIQVGEQMSTTQQDLTNLFEKRKSSQGSPQGASQTPRTSMPVRSSGSSQPFRSLNDLLGIKKTPIGHLVSPYEERHPPPPPNISDSPDRAPKRQKVPPAETPLADRRQAPAQVVDLTNSEKAPSSTGPRNIPSMRETQRPPKKSHSSPLPPRDKQSNAPKATTQPTPDPTPFAKPPLPPPSASSKRAPEPAMHTPAREGQTKPTETGERPSNAVPPSRPAPGKSSGDAPTSTLRMSTEKPRRKLMYSALLPSETSQKSSPPIKSSPTSAMPPPEKRSQSTPRALDQSVRTRDRH